MYVYFTVLCDTGSDLLANGFEEAGFVNKVGQKPETNFERVRVCTGPASQ